MASIPYYGYNYDPNCADTSETGQGIYTIRIGPGTTSTGSSTYHSSNYSDVPYVADDDAEEDESGPPSPWWWLVPEDQRCPVVCRGSSVPPRRPARCRDPPS
jgi:hypothetical protein